MTVGDKLFNYLLFSLGRGKSNVELPVASREPLGEQVGWGLFSFWKESLPFLVSIPCTDVRPGLVLAGRQEQPQHFLSVQRQGHVPLGSCCVPCAAKPRSLG